MRLGPWNAARLSLWAFRLLRNEQGGVSLRLGPWLLFTTRDARS
jgi:hypothetical protein